MYSKYGDIAWPPKILKIERRILDSGSILLSEKLCISNLFNYPIRFSTIISSVFLQSSKSLNFWVSCLLVL